ncbi:Serine/threonine phosphatase stp [Poriferisphaera corsica]|uniref:Serine/threonine phosphatase stp n=1 Tax=Poriferisphaera corsica TaxID=2528020 RepID=A0A517YYP7_9BACT|nr:protein phosphatase 2C domain-containing protein [Poriferisphaera corsica]QDU35335.1 Serine/threonine phosphatase stp [Poriferisphaera corsica]
MVPDIISASLTDIGRRRLANEDAFYNDLGLNLHVVCDGIGGQPSGEAASQIIAYSLGRMLRMEMRRGLGEGGIEDALRRVIGVISEQLYIGGSRIGSLKGMGATLVGMLVVGEVGYVFNVGDSRAYLFRDGELRQVSEDHTAQYRQYDSITDTLKDEQVGERRLLSEFIGAPRQVNVAVKRVEMAVGDQMLLCSDGLTDPVEEWVIKKILTQGYPIGETVRVLVEAANRAGGPDNVTVTLMDWRGMKTGEMVLEERDRAGVVSGEKVVAELRKRLLKLGHDLEMLHGYAEECRSMNQIGAFAAIKRWLGPELYAMFLSMSPSKNPMHAFHHAFTLERSPWRKAYDEHVRGLQPVIDRVVSGGVALSEFLHPHDTAAIVHTLWADWRRVEQLYFKLAASAEHTKQHERVVNLLIKHMFQSVSTLAGLLAFFDLYMTVGVGGDEVVRGTG